MTNQGSPPGPTSTPCVGATNPTTISRVVTSEPQSRPEAAVVPTGPYQRALVWIRKLGHDPAVILRRAEIDPTTFDSPGGLITLDQVEALVLVAAEVVGQPGRSLDLGGQLLFPAYGEVGFAALTAPTVSDAVAVAETYLELITPLFAIERTRVSGFLQVRVAPNYLLAPEVFHIHLRVVMSSLHALLLNVIGGVPEGLELDLPLDDPDLLEWLREHDVTVRPSGGLIAVRLPFETAEAPLPLADADAHAGFIARCQQLLEDRHTRDRTIRDVRRALRAAGAPFPEIESLSPQLDLSPRELQRRLKDEGVTFHQLFTEARVNWAARELAGSDRPISEISYELGYSTPGNFTRAFRQAMGVSPTEYRRRRLEGSAR